VPNDPNRAAEVSPTISVIICAYTMDRLEVLAEAIESVVAQTFPAREIVLVIDHSPELMAAAGRRWPDLLIVANSEKQGLSGARNSGVAEASGDVVAFLDDDAIAEPTWLERLTAAYRDPDVIGAGGAVRPRWLAGKPGWFPPEFDWVVGCTHSGMPQEPAAVRNLVGANMSFRREPLVEVGGFSHELGRVGTLPVGCEETDLSIRIGQRWPAAEIRYDPAATVDHVVPPARGKASYFFERCAAEGRSKAILTAMVGSQDGLSAERSYVRRTLPLGVLRDLRTGLGGDGGGFGRAAMIVAGLAATTAGYTRVRLRGRADPAADERAGAGSRPRVLMVTPRSPMSQGGVERHVMEVSRRMAAAGAHVEVICGDTEIDGARTEVRDGVEIHTVRARPRGRDYFFAPGIWKEMSRREWDVIHVQSYHTLVAPLAMLRALSMKVPYVVTFHGGGHSSELRNRARRLQMRLLRPLLARASRLVAVARFEIEEYGSALRLPADRFALIPNGTDLSFSDGDLHGREPVTPTLATIGRLERYKGHHRVIAALPAVLEREPSARLLVVGSGPYEDDLRRQAADLGVADSVEFTSVPGDDPMGMATLLGGVSLVVLMSDFETHPLVALEAAAARRRLLVADQGGLGELAADGFARPIDPEAGPEALAAAVLEELARPLPQRSPSLSSWDECATALLDLYGSIIQRGHTSSAREAD
jgi:glycosyltransferase involved in cell wall biosynthesis/GT2 family glycosyltransferase